MQTKSFILIDTGQQNISNKLLHGHYKIVCKPFDLIVQAGHDILHHGHQSHLGGPSPRGTSGHQGHSQPEKREILNEAKSMKMPNIDPVWTPFTQKV